jgi:hypothetical protein
MRTCLGIGLALPAVALIYFATERRDARLRQLAQCRRGYGVADITPTMRPKQEANQILLQNG